MYNPNYPTCRRRYLRSALVALGVALALAGVRVAQAAGETCFATPNDGGLVYASTTASAVRDAVAAAGSGGTVKIAGYCAGAVNQLGTSQVAVITQTLTLAGGYTTTNWTTAYPITQPTILDAQGGGRVINASAELTLIDLTVQRGNYSTSGNGGGLYASTAVTLTNVSFLTNTANGGSGGGAMVSSATLNGGLFQNNTASSNGGGLWSAAFALTDTRFISNTAGQSGGGALGGPATLNGGLFQNNRADSQGGGLYAGGGGTLSLSGTQFLSNTATNTGGGLVAVGNPTIVIGGLFQNNQSASAAGGGLHAADSFELTGTRFLDNAAETTGGGLYHGSGTGRVVNALFAGNLARNGSGSGLYLVSSGSVSILHTTIASPTIGSGSAIFIDNASGMVGITNTLVASYPIGIGRNAGAVYEDHNLFSGVATPYVGSITSGGNSITGAAGFINPATANYRLGLGSSAINAGVNAGIATDFEGTPRPTGGGFDIGYDESSIPPRAWLPLLWR